MEHEERTEHVKQVIRKEFDVEILYKWREIRILEDELEKGEQLKILLEKLILNENVHTGNQDRSASFVASLPPSRMSTPGPIHEEYEAEERTSNKRVRQASIAAQNRTETIFQGESNSRSSGSGNEPGPLFEMCPDGSVVRLRCPVCGADRFRSILGMVNHCRINCGLMVANPDDRIQQCGIPVAANELPSDFFISKGIGQLKRERELAQIRAGVQAPIIDTVRKPIIREFSETETSVILTPDNVASEGERSKMIPSSIASHQADVETLHSRYYIRKRIIIGNIARHLDNVEDLNEVEAATRQIPTHEWRLFIRPYDRHDDIEGYIERVRFHLHPSYAPNDVIDISGKPFELRMTGWGEFPARLEVFFKNPKNKSVEFVHFIRLYGCKSRSPVLMSEQAYDLELDKKTFVPPSESITFDDNSRPESNVYSVDDALAVASRQFPLFGSTSSKPTTGQAYNKAVSYAEFMKLSTFDQAALEKERALALQRHLLPAHPELTVDYVVEWCRRNGLTPLVVPNKATISNTTDLANYENEDEDDDLGITEGDLQKLQYCRYCGLAHFPQEKFEILQKNCAMRPRKLHLSSRSTATELVSKFTIATEPINEVKKSRIIEAHVQIPGEIPPGEWEDEERWIHESINQLDLSSYQPQKETAKSILLATKAFIKDLLLASMERLPDSIEMAVGRPAILTPLHLYQAITGLTPVPISAPKEIKSSEDTGGSQTNLSTSQTPSEPTKFDFLSNAFMAGT